MTPPAVSLFTAARRLAGPVSGHILIGTWLVTALAVPEAAAHGFGSALDLAVPVWLWLGGAALSLLIAFAAVIDFLPKRLTRIDYPRLSIGTGTWCAPGLSHALLRVAQITVAGLFVLTIVAALCGTGNAERNLAPTMVWVVFWVGVALSSALLGDFWTKLNPLRNLYTAAYRLVRRTWPPATPNVERIDAWPALVLLVVFAWGEHIWSGASVPGHIGVSVLIYSLFTMLGMARYGRDRWLSSAEVFAVLFSLFAAMSPLETDRAQQRSAARRRYLRVPGSGLLVLPPLGPSMLVFVLAVPALVSFDGFIETANWQNLVAELESVRTDSLIQAPLLNSVALLAFPTLFVAAFMITCLAMRYTAASLGRSVSVLMIATRFAVTLLPIAFAFYFAHYITALTAAGAQLVPLLSDPFGYGWNLFGTADYTAVGLGWAPQTWWNLMIVAIVVGQVLSVFIAHVIALDVFGDKRTAIVSELPLVAVLIAYSVFSLWLMAQPDVA